MMQRVAMPRPPEGEIPMTTRFTEALSLSIPIEMRARVIHCAGAWICLYTVLTVGSVVTSF
jgi:hypothetical protein